MNQSHYDREMDRLRDVFGDRAYSGERVIVIWKEVKDLSDAWFSKTIDRFIGEFRHAPLMPEFRDAISLEREKVHSYERQKNKTESERAMHQLFDGNHISTICKTIVGRVQGNVSDQKFTEFTHGLEKLTRVGCKHCDDSGLVFWKDAEGYEWTYRCICPYGSRQPKSFPSYFNKLRGVS
jgi:hypothetical protein